jgi:hypothetical protein
LRQRPLSADNRRVTDEIAEEHIVMNIRPPGRSSQEITKVIAGLRGNAGAGGAMLALAADRVYARQGVVLNPHYKRSLWVGILDLHAAAASRVRPGA